MPRNDTGDAAMLPMHDDYLPADPRIPKNRGARKPKTGCDYRNLTELASERSAETPGRARRGAGRYGGSIDGPALKGREKRPWPMLALMPIFVGARQLVRQEGGRAAHFTVRQPLQPTQTRALTGERLPIFSNISSGREARGGMTTRASNTAQICGKGGINTIGRLMFGRFGRSLS